jgi:hypothetical protein
VLPSDFLSQARNIGLVNYNLDMLDTNPPTRISTKSHPSPFGELETNRYGSGFSGVSNES